MSGAYEPGGDPDQWKGEQDEQKHLFAGLVGRLVTASAIDREDDGSLTPLQEQVLDILNRVSETRRMAKNCLAQTEQALATTVDAGERALLETKIAWYLGLSRRAEAAFWRCVRSIANDKVIPGTQLLVSDVTRAEFLAEGLVRAVKRSEPISFKTLFTRPNPGEAA